MFADSRVDIPGNQFVSNLKLLPFSREPIELYLTVFELSQVLQMSARKFGGAVSTYAFWVVLATVLLLALPRDSSAQPTIFASDCQTNFKNFYLADEPVCALFNPMIGIFNTADICVVPPGASPIEQNDVTSDGCETVELIIGPDEITVWSPPTTPGKYDLVIIRSDGGSARDRIKIEIVFASGFEECETASVESCYEGPPGTAGIGQCKVGTRTCLAGGNWGPCNGSILPSEDICGDGIDNDCDGANPGCAGDFCNPLDSDGSCDDGLGCYITACRDTICNAECDTEGPGREGSACSESSDCRSGMQCWSDGTQSACFRSCDPENSFSCSLGSICLSTGAFVDGKEIGACSVP